MAGVVGIELEHFPMLIDGKLVEAASGRTYQTENPYRGEPWATVPDAASEDVDAAVSAARAALEGPWGSLTGFARAALMRRLARSSPRTLSGSPSWRSTIRANCCARCLARLARLATGICTSRVLPTS